MIWRKASEPNPISVGEEIFFSKDNRFNVSISRERREFNLVIQDVRRSDAGVYECQVPAKDKLIRLVLLIVLGNVVIFLFNLLPDMPILGSSNSPANNDIMSKIWTNYLIE